MNEVEELKDEVKTLKRKIEKLNESVDWLNWKLFMGFMIIMILLNLLPR